MPDPIELPLDAQDRLYDLPWVDHAVRTADGFEIDFIPADDVSQDEKCSIRVPLDSFEGRRIAARFDQLEALTGRAKLHRITHGGGGDFSLAFHDDAPPVRLQDLHHTVTHDAADAIDRIAKEAEFAYRLEHQTSHRRSA